MEEASEMKKRIVTAALVTIAAAMVLWAQGGVLDLDEIMTRKEQRETGVVKLAPSERHALEKWLTDWTRDAIEYGKQQAAAEPSSVGGGTGPTASPYKGWISEVQDRGRFLVLDDGSLWEVSSLDRIYTGLGLTTEDVRVLPGEGEYPGYGHLLVNLSNGEAVSVKRLSD